MGKSLFVHITIELTGSNMPSRFADKVTDAFPSKPELEDLRAASVPAMLPISFRLQKEKVSDPQCYLQISESATPATI